MLLNLFIADIMNVTVTAMTILSEILKKCEKFKHYTFFATSGMPLLSHVHCFQAVHVFSCNAIQFLGHKN